MKKASLPTAAALYVDVGGTKTRFEYLLKNRKKPFSQSKPTSLDTLPDDIFRFYKRHASSAGVREVSLFVGLRGAWTPREKALWRKKLVHFFPRVTVLSDVELTYQRLFGDDPGVLLIAGTGSIAFGKDGRGGWARAGGLGPFFGDEGSGFWIGREWLKAGSNMNWKALRPLAKDPQAVRRIAARANDVLKRAEERHPVARDIVNRATVSLLKLVVDVKRQLKIKTAAPLALHGGLFQNAFFRRVFLKRLNVAGFTFSVLKG